MSIFADLEAGVSLPTESDTLGFAARLAKEVPADSTITLSGDLGAGKTTFVKGLARGLGVEEAVTSPSFTVCNFHRGRRLLAHVDAYRLSENGEWDDLMIEEFLASPWCLVVEWPDRVAENLPTPRLDLWIKAQPDGTRFIQNVSPSFRPPPGISD